MKVAHMATNQQRGNQDLQLRSEAPDAHVVGAVCGGMTRGRLVRQRLWRLARSSLGNDGRSESRRSVAGSAGS